MTSTSDLITSESYQSATTKQRQRVQVLDTIYAISGLGIVFGAVYMVHLDGLGWRLSILANVLVLIALLVGFFAMRQKTFHRTVILIVSIFFWVLNELAFGLSSGLHYLLLAAPAVMFFALGIRFWWLILICTVIATAVFLLAELYFPWSVGLARTGYTVAWENLQNNNLDADDVLFTSSILTMQLVVYMTSFRGFRLLETAEQALQSEYKRSEALLSNLLPQDIAARLKLEPNRTIADKLPNVAILFADIVDFTPRAAQLPPEQVVGFLNRVFSRFDLLADRHGLEKIKTIGDAYMVAAGMPSPVGNPTHRIAEMALDMQRAVHELAQEFPEGLEVRIGLHSGPAVAGVIGNRKLFYDVWGETVNTASRMESFGQPGRIQVTGAAFRDLKRDYAFEERGTVDIKGVGLVETWWLVGRLAG